MPREIYLKIPSRSLPRTLAATVGLAFVTTGCHSAHRSSASEAVRLHRDVLDSIPRWMAQHHVPAVAIALIDHNQTTTLRAYGELRRGTPATLEALYNVASLTKPVVAMTTLRLANAGLLDLDAPLAADWVDPDLRDDTRHLKLTARTVLTHRTGFPNWRVSQANGKLAFVAEPGTRFGYSGEGFEYLRRALERKFGRSLQQLSDTMLFRELHMRSTTYGWHPLADTLRYALPHDRHGVSLTRPRLTTDQPNAADWLVTTIGDYAQFAKFVLAHAGLSDAVWADMASPHVASGGAPYEFMGLGWEVITGEPRDDPILLHSGHDDGVYTRVVVLPRSQRALVIFANSDGGDELIGQVVHLALRVSRVPR